MSSGSGGNDFDDDDNKLFKVKLKVPNVKKRIEEAKAKREQEIGSMIAMNEEIRDQVIGAATTMMVFAFENLDKLVIDKSKPVGDPKRVIWPEAFYRLREIAAMRAIRKADGTMHIPAPTTSEYLDMLEEFVINGKLSFANIDRSLNGLPPVLNGILNGGLGAGVEILHAHPEHVQSLSEKKEKLFMNMLEKNPETVQYALLMRTRPNLMKFVSYYVLTKLGIEVPLEFKPVIRKDQPPVQMAPKPQIIVQSSPPPQATAQPKPAAGVVPTPPLPTKPAPQAQVVVEKKGMQTSPSAPVSNINSKSNTPGALI